MSFKCGDLVDVLDTTDNLWSPAVITSVQKDKYGINYVGWGEEFDEVIAMSSGRLIVGGTHVNRVKSWVRLAQQICWWPCVLYIRKPAGDIGIENLREEKKVFVKPCGPNTFPIKPYFDGVWKNTKYVSPFSNRYEIRYYAGCGEAKYCKAFQAAIDELHASDAFKMNFRFDGSYECRSTTDTISGTKRERSSAVEPEPQDNTLNGAREVLGCPYLRAIQSKSHFLQAIRHSFVEDPWGIKPSAPELNFNIRDHFAKKLTEIPVNDMLINKSSCDSSGPKKKQSRKPLVVMHIK